MAFYLQFVLEQCIYKFWKRNKLQPYLLFARTLYFLINYIIKSYLTHSAQINRKSW